MCAADGKPNKGAKMEFENGCKSSKLVWNEL